jgi:hypothetical protein
MGRRQGSALLLGLYQSGSSEMTPPKWRRLIAHILIAAGAGVGLNIAVAWLSVYASYHRLLVEQLPSPVTTSPSKFTASICTGSYDEIRVVTSASTFGASAYMIEARAQDGAQTEGLVLTAGWPMRSLSLVELDDCVTGVIRVLEPRAGGGFGRRPLFSTIRGLKLPSAPNWPGSTLNVMAYGTAIFFMSSLPRLIKRRVRASRGHCTECGYPLGQSSRCPECGVRAAPKCRARTNPLEWSSDRDDNT